MSTTILHWLIVKIHLDERISEDGRKEVFDFCIDQLNSDRLTNHVAKELIGKLLVEVSKLLD